MPGSQFPDKRLERLEDQHIAGKNNSSYPGEPPDRKAKNCDRRNKGEFPESRIQIHGGCKNPLPENLGWSDITTGENLITKSSKEASPQKFSPGFTKLTEPFSLLFARAEIVVSEELKKQVAHALHFGHPGLTKMLGDDNIFFLAETQKDIKDFCTTCSTCNSFGKNFKYHLPMTQKINLPVLTESGQEKQIEFSGKLHKEHVTEEPYLIGIDLRSKWTVNRICKSTKAGEVIKFLETFTNLNVVPENMKLDRESAFISKFSKAFCKNQKNLNSKKSTKAPHWIGGMPMCNKSAKNLIIANLEGEIGINESVRRALRRMRPNVHTGLQVSPSDFTPWKKTMKRLNNPNKRY